jgi:hypothetical protein
MPRRRDALNPHQDNQTYSNVFESHIGGSLARLAVTGRRKNVGGVPVQMHDSAAFAPILDSGPHHCRDSASGVSMLYVQILALIGLFLYVIETMKIRRATQRQVESSLDLIRAATAQVEGMSKPCLTLWGELRDGTDAILEMHGAVGNVVAGANAGSYVVQNIGNGVALNVRYRFTRPNDDPDRPREMRYVPNILPAQRVTLVETLGGYNAEHEVTFNYESIGGRRYRTTIQLNHYVITSFLFEEVRPQNLLG